ncbi:gephyrin-like molybdotransferase Glp [Corynebacterium choanae]|uniref:Molybdopterin molybdenumtransferase n=1 Tax=Corynebacterium choanae TaxID=1862358 RepID=A0A3G6J5S3_9CORY|nr:gephyrin-like molybdotransferase Glp [Corynebacterium choanae]AZA13435.1 Molybdopterin molybdenumtransferase [Corynebacterium choanae]
MNHTFHKQPLATIAQYRQQCLTMAEDYRPPVATLPLAQAHNKIAASDVTAQVAIPPWTNSAMDGFIIRNTDLPAQFPCTLPVAGDIPAGSAPQPVPAGHLLRIFTGAPIAPGDEDTCTVIPVEYTNIAPGPQPLPATVTIEAAPTLGAHIRRAGEHLQPGDRVVAQGSRIDAGVIAALASTGHSTVPTFVKPRVAVVSSGDELLPPGCALAPGQIPDSNGPMLQALAAAYSDHIDQVHLGDDPDTFSQQMTQLAATHDLIITTGGVSAGAFDPVKAAFGEQLTFTQVAMQPGKPQGLGRIGDAVVVALPGNPVSAWVSFHLFVAPVLQVLGGQPAPPLQFVERKLDGDVQAHKSRVRIIPAVCHSGDTVCPTQRGFGSHFATAMAGAQALIVLPPQATPSTHVQVLLLDQYAT